MKETLKKQTDLAIEELSNSLKENHSFETLENWLNKNKEIELETLKYTFEENEFADFWFLFYWIEEMLKFFRDKVIIEKCILEFKNIDKGNTETVYAFLLKLEPLLKSFSFNNNNNFFKVKMSLQKDLIKFSELDEYKNAAYLHLNITNKYSVFYYLKNSIHASEEKLKEEIKEILLR